MLEEIKIAHKTLKCSWWEAIKVVLELHRNPIILAKMEDEEDDD